MANLIVDALTNMVNAGKSENDVSTFLPSSSPELESLWGRQANKYSEYWEHFTGDWLDEVVTRGEKSVSKYPLKMNPYKLACLLHVGFLYGESPYSDEPQASPRVSLRVERDPDTLQINLPTREDVALGEMLTDVLHEVWRDSYGRSVELESALVAQVLGGCVLGVNVDHSRKKMGLSPIRIEHLLPDYFFPVWHPQSYFELIEAHVMYRLSSSQANLLYGVDSSVSVAYHEIHSLDDYEIRVNDEIARYNNRIMKSEQIWGIPYTYIPHPPRIGGFYGESLLDKKLGLAKEVNHRMADIGDTIADEAYNLPVVANVQGASVRNLGGGLRVLELQSSPGRPEPKVWFDRTQRVNAASRGFVHDLVDVARTEAYTPPGAYGEQESSQRSAMTLALSLIPLTMHIKQERAYFSTGLNQVDERILHYAARIGYRGVTPELVDRAVIKRNWSPILARDSEKEVNELVMRLQAGVISPQTAMEILGDIDDVPGEMNRIIKWFTDKAQAQRTQQSQDPFKGTGSMGQNSGLERPDRTEENESDE